jgi:hypothetical protein
MITVETSALPSLTTFVTSYRKSHTTIVTGRHERGVKVFTDYSERMPGVSAIQYAHEGFVPGRIVRSVSLDRAPKNEVEESAADILQSSDKIMSVMWIRTSDDSGYGLLITPSISGASTGGRPVLLTAARSDHSDAGLFMTTFLNACPILHNEHISDPDWYASTLNLMGERCVSFM